MIFVTVGTQFPFERLVRKLDTTCSQYLAGRKVFAQIGASEYRPSSFDYAQSLSSREFETYMKESSAVIGHAGMGTITMAMEYNKPLLVLPRLKKFGEVVNDHQVAIARRFEASGYLLAAYSEDELPGKLEELMDFVPKRRQVDAGAVSSAIAEFLKEASGSKLGR
jgi:beta-1,4-N-acetylglucosaminyltransferase